MSVAAFNNAMHQLYAAIPRRIPNLSKYDVTRKAEFDKKLSDEQELLDFMLAQIRTGAISGQNQTILDAYQMEWRGVTEEEKEFLKNKLGKNRAQYLRAWRVKNHRTEKAFDKYCAPKNLTLENGGITELFHGSRTENFWSITTNGLYLNPSGVVITGKAFGHGLYFAPLAQKSIGYTSSYGSYWSHGDNSKGYLAVYKVATGEIYDIYGEGKGVPDNYNELQQKHPGADCTWAFSRSKNATSYLQNEEVIVYREDQCTIEYLIEFSAAH
jgi:poly [ADP-ribose] polymerase